MWFRTGVEYDGIDVIISRPMSLFNLHKYLRFYDSLSTMPVISVSTREISDIVAKGIEKAAVERPLGSALTVAGWSVIGTILAITAAGIFHDVFSCMSKR